MGREKYLLMKPTMITLILVSCIAGSVSAQLFGKNDIARFLEKQIERYAPEILQDVGGIEGLSLDVLKVKSKSIIAKGRADIFNSEETGDPFRFKCKIRVRSGLGLKYLKVHPPGRNFLGFPLYKKIYP